MQLQISVGNRQVWKLSAFVMAALAALLVMPAAAQDVTRPAPVSGVAVTQAADDVELSWDPVTLDAAGNAETVDQYHVYRGTTPDFVPDRLDGTNRIGTSAGASFTDVGAASDPDDYFYRVSAVDSSGNESNSQNPQVTTPAILTGSWSIFNVHLDWIDAEPVAEVESYRVYYGKSSGVYEQVADVGLANSFNLTGIQPYINYYSAVTAVDSQGNESAFSNEAVDAIAGIVRARAHDEDELCWGATGCVPLDPNKIQRNNGWQLLAPITFPEGDWTSVKVTYTLESRLCSFGNQGTTSKCGTGNPCPEPPCNGGYNPCGDPWDRLAHLFLVLDDCVEGGGSCLTSENLELMRAVTPFGTDADPPDGTGFVPPRELTLDVTPFAPLLTGTRYIAAEIVHFVQGGWWVTVEFEFSERPDQASDKPPADGIEILGFANAPLPTKEFSVPLEATEVKARVFTTGHGGSLFCDGGANNASPCTSGADCPGGVCNPCDEFCHRSNSLLIDNTPVWTVTPWRFDCSGNPHCSSWNACGNPSCTFPRAGWCPGYIACTDNAPCDNDLDLTLDIPPGGTYDMDYTVSPQNGSWPVSVVLYWYE